ncbi:butyrophilin subfamily 1 member A1-like [Ctenopharyngodon idella]|uniref:butyrophilin subfamily 1 member A1-like n=1 Tax=Ctenopharyngodon idella TaxID=7959 RepID=UPI002232613C|nr:butyrophilin subfamily 1 member A1-like [Ctenopharyngodon idella]XP_051754976.1 butyrophilin subfamily 1 member A1-like [Ctenopharyngodon idella]
MKLIGVALICCALTDLTSELYNVVGPAEPLFTVAGEDVILPCYIKPNTSAVDMTVEWFRLDQDEIVHLYKNRENRITEHSQSYKGRTALFQDELQNGNASLKLSTVQVSDEGVYKCFIESNSWYDDITVNVNVGAIGTYPLIIIEEFDHSGGLRLLCECEGWNPKPELLWLDSKGDVLISDTTESHKDAKGFSVKHRITVHNSETKYHCRVKLRHHMLQTDISVSSKMFHIWRTSVIWISITVVFGTITAVAIATFVYIRRVRYTRRIQKEIAKRRKYAVDVTLDPDTAHESLILSDDGKQVRRGEKKQNVPGNPERFDKCGNVLGKQGFSSGRFYFEVQVKGKTDWDLGVAKESINRKGKITLSPENGYWTVRLRNGNQYSACAGTSVSLSLKVKPQKVGVFVDYEEGLVSFYNVESKSHIYSFTDHWFTDKLYPFLNPCTNIKGKYSAPMIIAPISFNE